MAEVRTRIRVTDNATNTLNKINSKYAQLLRTMNSVSASGANMPGSMGAGTQAMKKQAEAADMLSKKLLGVAKAYLGVMGAKAIIGTSDALTGSDNRLRTLAMRDEQTPEAAVNFSSETMDKIFNSAQRAATGYTDMAKNVSKTVTLAGKAFGSSLETQIDNAIIFQEVMAKSYALGGATAQEQASSMYQLTQALGAGILAGDELRSVREGAPLAYQQIEKFAQKTLSSEKALKDLASQGLITSDLVVAAIMDMREGVDEQFKHVKLTFGQLWTKFKNETTRAFQPFLEKLRAVSNSTAFQNLTADVVWFVKLIAGMLTTALSILGGVIEFLGRNSTVVRGLLVGLAVVLGVMFVQACMLAISSLWGLITTWAAANATVLLFAVLVAGVVMVANYFSLSAQQLGVVLLVLAGILGIVGLVLMLLNVPLFGITATTFLWIAAIVLLIAIFMLATDKVMGAVYAMVAGIRNYFVYLWNIVVTWVNFFANVFKDPVASVQILFLELVNNVIGYVETMLKAIESLINKIPGVEIDITSGLANFKAGLETKISTIKDESGWQEVMAKKEFGDLGDAYNKGAEKGNAINSAITDFFQGKVRGSGKDAIETPLDISDSVGNIDKNTGKMSKSMDTSAEDLKYLRLLAEKEAINKFTTAEIRVDMTNNNTMNNMGDLDGIVTHLDRVLREELSVLAEGVHA